MVGVLTQFGVLGLSFAVLFFKVGKLLQTLVSSQVGESQF